jgi:dTDP-4-amino-4,6-dideoxygalactose transaminase
MSKFTDNKIGFFGVSRENQEHGSVYLKKISKVLSHGKVLQGDEVSEFERKVSSLCNRSYGIAVNSCTDAIYFSLLASGVEPNDEVLVTDFSFIASASAILRAGAKPIFIDIDESFLMDLDRAKEHISERTKAIIFVNLFGQMGDPKIIREFALLNKLDLIEDAAQSLGAHFESTKSGSLGDISCLSFDPTKVIGSPGSGGMVLTDERKLAKKLTSLRYHGQGKKGEFDSLGYNSQMPSLIASVLNYKLDQNEKWLSKRREIARYYIENINEPIIMPVQIPNSGHIYHKFVIRLENRKGLKNYLDQNNIQTMIHYKKPLHKHKLFQLYNINDHNFPKTLAISRSVLSLPIHPFLRDYEVDYIVKKINNFVKNKLNKY